MAIHRIVTRLNLSAATGGFLVVIGLSMFVVSPQLIAGKLSVSRDEHGIQIVDHSLTVRNGTLFWQWSEIAETLSQKSSAHSEELLRGMGMPNACSMGLNDMIVVTYHWKKNITVFGNGVRLENTCVTGKLGGGWSGANRLRVLSINGMAPVCCGLAVCSFAMFIYRRSQVQSRRRGFMIGGEI